MEIEYWHRVERVLDLALETDPSDWSAVLSSACENDRALRDDVEDLLSRFSTAASPATDSNTSCWSWSTAPRSIGTASSAGSARGGDSSCFLPSPMQCNRRIAA